METHLDAGRLQEPDASLGVIWNKEPWQSSYHLLVIYQTVGYFVTVITYSAQLGA
jgi:hypothetical protein